MHGWNGNFETALSPRYAIMKTAKNVQSMTQDVTKLLDPIKNSNIHQKVTTIQSLGKYTELVYNEEPYFTIR